MTMYTIYGRPKVGKTTFALNGTDPLKTLVIDADCGLTAIDTTGMTILEDVSSTTLSKRLTQKDLRPFRRIVVDTATSLYESLLLEAAGGRAPNQGTYGQANTILGQILRQLRSSRADVIIICQEKVVKPTEDWAPEDDEEESVASVAPGLPPGAGKTLLAMSDVIGRMYIAQTVGGPKRKLWITPTPGVVAGARSAKATPDSIVTPSLTKLKNTLGYK